MKKFKKHGIYTSIIFSKNLNRQPAWVFSIDTVEDNLYTSTRYYSRKKCKKKLIKKALEYVKK